MDADKEKFKYKEYTDLVLKAYYQVYNTLGYGFLEKVYLNALLIEFEKLGLEAKPQHAISVLYADKIVGEYYADIMIQNCILVEIEAAKTLTLEHEAQLLNYLKATNVEVGLLLNFGPQAEFKRKAFSNSRKLHG
jgi:GxxExxY protein